MEVLNQKIITKTFSHGGNYVNILGGTDSQTHTQSFCVRLRELPERLVARNDGPQAPRYVVSVEKVLRPAGSEAIQRGMSYIAEGTGTRERFSEREAAIERFGAIADEFHRPRKCKIIY